MPASIFSPRTRVMFRLGFLADAVETHLSSYRETRTLPEPGKVTLERALDFLDDLETGGRMTMSVGSKSGVSGAVPDYRQSAARAYHYALNAWSASRIAPPSDEKELRQRCSRYREALRAVVESKEVEGLEAVLDEVESFFSDIGRRTLLQTESSGLR